MWNNDDDDDDMSIEIRHKEFPYRKHYLVSRLFCPKQYYKIKFLSSTTLVAALMETAELS